MILEEGNHPYPRCPQCDMFVPQNSLNGRHLATLLCRGGVERKWRCLEEEEARVGMEGMDRSLTAYIVPLSRVIFFKYMG